MPTLKNTNPLGDVTIHGVGPVAAGAEFEVTDAQAERLLKQRGNYELVKTPTIPTAAPKKKG